MVASFRHIALAVLLLSLPFPLSAQTRPPTNRPSAPMTDQEVLLLLSGETSTDRIILTLNNNRPDALLRTLPFTAWTGHAIPFPTCNLWPRKVAC